jgi:hypothetical protein
VRRKQNNKNEKQELRHKLGDAKKVPEYLKNTPAQLLSEEPMD